MACSRLKMWLAPWAWQHWSIRTRLMLGMLLPIAYLFCSVVWYSYQSRLGEARDELAERASIVATALSESLENHVQARNVSGLQWILKGLVQSDQSIYQIEVFDKERHLLAQVKSYLAQQPDAHFVEMPIKKQLIWVSLIAAGQGSAANGVPAVASTTKADSVGFVRVIMSPSTMQGKQSRRFYIELGMAALALAVSAALALFLSKSLTQPLQTAMQAVNAIRAGEYATQVQVSTGGEIGQLQAAINQMAASLRAATDELEHKVAERTRDLLASRNQALQADAEKRRLIQKVHSIVEDERKSIAIEIHDELNASLIAARLDSQRILALASKARPQDESAAQWQEVQEKARAIIKTTLDLYASGRSLVRRLRPEVLDMLGLPGAVEEMLRHYNANPEQCQFRFSAEGEFAGLPGEMAISAYRIVQEALSNIIKHAGARHAVLRLEMAAQELHITIEDDGVGFDSAQNGNIAHAGIGITGMRERVYAFHGQIVVSSAVGAGTQIHIRLPLPDAR